MVGKTKRDMGQGKSELVLTARMEFEEQWGGKCT